MIQRITTPTLSHLAFQLPGKKLPLSPPFSPFLPLPLPPSIPLPLSSPSIPTICSLSHASLSVGEHASDRREVSLTNLTSAYFTRFYSPPSATTKNELWTFLSVLPNKARVNITVSILLSFPPLSIPSSLLYQNIF